MDRVTTSVLIPASGPSGLFGPSTRDCAVLACKEINDAGGILGRELELNFIDVGKPLVDVVNEVGASIRDGAVALVGAHDSAVRRAVCAEVGKQVPYIYTPPYEGDETGAGLIVLGETPYQQLSRVLPWFMEKKQINTWFLLGNSYQWPYVTNWLAKQYIGILGGETLAEEYVPFGCENFDHALRRIDELKPDGILITLVGNDSVSFNRAFAERGYAESIIRLGLLIEENTLLGIGVENSRGIYSVSGYFTCIDTAANNAFIERYTSMFGSHAPVLNVVGQSCYDGLHLLAWMAAKAKSLDANKVSALSEGFVFESPRGLTTIHNHHSTKTIYLGAAEGIDFTIEASFSAVPALAPSH